MFNIEERAPIVLGGVLLAIHTIVSFGPQVFARLLRGLFVLVPMGLEDILPSRQVLSLIGSAFIHASWTHVLVTVGMMVAFSVVTLRGIRARQTEMRHVGKAPRLSAEVLFVVIFLAGGIIGGLFQWGWWAASNAPSGFTLGAMPSVAALFATAAWAMGGRERLVKYGGGWVLANVLLYIAQPLFGPVAWASHIGGYVAGALLAPYLVKPFSSGFSITR